MLISILWNNVPFIVEFGFLAIDANSWEPSLVTFFLIVFWANNFLYLFFKPLVKQNFNSSEGLFILVKQGRIPFCVSLDLILCKIFFWNWLINLPYVLLMQERNQCVFVIFQSFKLIQLKFPREVIHRCPQNGIRIGNRVGNTCGQ